MNMERQLEIVKYIEEHMNEREFFSALVDVFFKSSEVEGTNQLWAHAYKDLAMAAWVLDAATARSTVKVGSLKEL